MVDRKPCKGCFAFDELDEICALAYLMRYKKKDDGTHEWIPAEDCPRPLNEKTLLDEAAKRRLEYVEL